MVIPASPLFPNENKIEMMKTHENILIISIILLSSVITLVDIGDAPVYQDEHLQVLQVKSIDDVGYPNNLYKGQEIVIKTTKKGIIKNKIPYEVFTGWFPAYVQYFIMRIFGFSRTSLRYL